MSQRFRFIEVNYHYHAGLSDPREVMRLHRSSNLFAEAIAEQAEVFLVKHLDREGSCKENNLHYIFFRRKDRTLTIPNKTHRWMRRVRPDMVLVQGFIFPIQVIALRLKLGRRPVILLQHHGEMPAGKKRFLQRLADRFVDGYLFTSIGNAEEWKKGGVIKKKCFELPSSSTRFIALDKRACQERTNMQGHLNFLWVGRLNANKDPLTVVRAFAVFAASHPAARLYLVYQEDDLLDEIHQTQERDPVLAEQLVLVGKLTHEDLETWYSAADYFISGSHREGGSYALTEAMACGCVPIVTKIPAAWKAIGEGQVGYGYEPGNSAALLHILHQLPAEGQHELSEQVVAHFRRELSAEAIARKLLLVYRELLAK